MIHEMTVNGCESKVINYNCIPLMTQFEDKYFDLAIVDPPYFSGPEKRGFYGNKTSRFGVNRGDYPITEKWEVPQKLYFDELFRISKNQIIWGCNYFDYHFGSGRIIWNKCNGGSSYSDCEIAYCSLHNSTRMFTYLWNGMMQGKSIKEGQVMQGNKKKNEKRIHPTQKPEKLYQWLLKEYSKPGQLVLDTHLGSGSHRIAAAKYGVNFIGIEKEKVHIKNHVEWFEDVFRLGRINFKY